MMRACAICDASLDGYRKDARYCGAGCRSAARHERAAQASKDAEVNLDLPLVRRAAQSRAEPCAQQLSLELSDAGGVER